MTVPHLDIMALECGDCQKKWPEFMTLPQPLETWCKRLKLLRCPYCGGAKLYILTEGRYWEAMAYFVQAGLIPSAISVPSS